MPTLVQERSYLRTAGDEPLPGYRLVAPLGIGGFGEVWKCVAPGGLQKAIKFVIENEAENDYQSLRQEHEAFQRVKGIRHPFLLNLERVELIGGELIMVMELADRSLENRLHDCQAKGLPGIPRGELLSYMVDAAEALDVLSRDHGLQHLDIKPANLFMLGGHVKVGDYGLVSRYRKNIRDTDGSRTGCGLTPKYVAPEILQDLVDSNSDQYSFALVYAELLTGKFPYSGKTARQLLLQHASADPDLSALPEADRPPVARALSKNPEQRFPNCLAFVRALLRESPEVPQAPSSVPSPPVRTSTTVPSPASLAQTLPRVTAPLLKLDNPATTQKNISATLMRHNTPAATLVVEEFTNLNPGWVFVSDVGSGTRGRVVHMRSPDHELHRVHLLKIDADTFSKYETVFAALSQPREGVYQTVSAHAPRSIVFQVPESRRTLKSATSRLADAKVPLPTRKDAWNVLGAVAMILDSLHKEFGFPHGLLTPAQIITQDKKYGISEFGIGQILHLASEQQDWLVDEGYAAPELYMGQPCPQSDQYSLALIYLVLFRAWSPPVRKSTRTESKFQRAVYDPTDLSKHEREAVKRALSLNPAERFSSCTQFIEAVQGGSDGRVLLDLIRHVESVERFSGDSPSKRTPPTPAQLTEAITRAAVAPMGVPFPVPGLPGVFRQPDGRVVARFPVRLTFELAEMKVKTFAAQWKYDLQRWTDDCFALRSKSGSMVFKVGEPSSATQPVELVVQIPNVDMATAAEIVVTARYTGRDTAKAAEQIAIVLENFRRVVKNTDERRKAPRYRTELPVKLFPVDEDLAVLPPITGHCRDVSASGFAAILEQVPEFTHAFVTFPSVPEMDGWALFTQVIRKQHHLGNRTLLAGKFICGQ